MRRKTVTWAVAVVGVLAAAADLFILVGSRQASTTTASDTLGSGSQPSSSTGASGSSGASAESSDSSTGSYGSDAGSSDDSSEDSGASGSSSATEDGTFTDGTFTGSTVNTEHGEIQVQVTVSGGKITTVTAVKYPDDEQRSISMSQQAIPQLSSEAVSAQGSDINMVSGATETSEGFIDSLQDAINQAEQG